MRLGTDAKQGADDTHPTTANSDLPPAPAPGGGGTIAPIDEDRLHHPSGRAGLGLGLTLTTVALWGMLPIGLKIVLDGMDPLTITWYRLTAAALILAPILAARGGLPNFRRLPAGAWRLLAIATVCLAANYGLYILGLDHTNAGTAQVVIQLAPVLLAVGGIWVFKERFGPIQWVGLAIMLSGLVIFSHDQIEQLVAGLHIYYVGIALTVAAAVAWAAYGLAQKQLLRHMSSPSIMLCIYVGSTVIFAPMAAPSQIFRLSGPQLAALVFCIFNTLLAYGTFAEALAHWEASRVSAVLAVVPLATLAMIELSETLIPALITPEPITVAGLAGACLVVSGSLMTALGRG